MMPGMGGPALAERLVHGRPDLRVLYISGYAEEAIQRHGLLPAGGALLEKPFTADELTVRVREVPPPSPGRRCCRSPSGRHASGRARPDGEAAKPPPRAPARGRGRAGAGRLRGAAAAHLRVRGHLPPGRRRRRRRAAGALPRPRRPDPRPSLRLHLQRGPRRVDDVRRRPAAAAALLLGHGSTARSPSAAGVRGRSLQVGAELLGQGDLAADVEMVRLTLELIRAAGLEDFQVNLGHVGVLAPGLGRAGGAGAAQVRRWIDRKDRGSLCARARGTGRATRAPLTICRSSSAGATRWRRRSARRRVRRWRACGTCWRSTTRSGPSERSHVVYDLGEVRGTGLLHRHSLRGVRLGHGPRGRRRRAATTS